MKCYGKEVKYKIRAKRRMCEYEMLWDTFLNKTIILVMLLCQDAVFTVHIGMLY